MATAPKKSSAPLGGSSQGPAVDAEGVAVVDPTKNVDSLVAASDRLNSELRTADRRYFDSQIEHLKQVQDLRDKRIDDLAELRAHYENQLAVKESERIDAIRAVDVGAVQIAQERANQQAAVLATTGQASAETLRNLVATTAVAAAAAQQQQIIPLDTRIRTLEAAGYVGQGKSALADPAFSELLTEVKNLRSVQSAGPTQDPAMMALITEVRSLSASRSERTGAGLSNALILGIVGVICSVILAVGVLVSLSGGSRSTAPPVPVIPPGYVLAPVPATGVKPP